MPHSLAFVTVIQKGKSKQDAVPLAKIMEGLGSQDTRWHFQKCHPGQKVVSWSSPKDDSHLPLTPNRDEKLLESGDSNMKGICITSSSPFPTNALQPQSLSCTTHQQGNHYFPWAAVYTTEGAYCQEVFPHIWIRCSISSHTTFLHTAIFSSHYRVTARHALVPSPLAVFMKGIFRVL